MRRLPRWGRSIPTPAAPLPDLECRQEFFPKNHLPTTTASLLFTSISLQSGSERTTLLYTERHRPRRK
ncbi:hypothetical protein E2C01_102387 [Portunus trituberculatus]|uniref:Uncharacterized protein n=1 Tax=Portunus trituberculatus TaxID=210409 RepID=A0A5B7KH67_PORTR|nr:hypothetical protein [Portunus trituberculatus]